MNCLTSGMTPAPVNLRVTVVWTEPLVGLAAAVLTLMRGDISTSTPVARLRAINR